jgi:hypothetical protein
VVADSWTDGAYLRAPTRYAGVVAGYHALFATARLVATIRSGDQTAHPGPDYAVYLLGRGEQRAS